MEEGEKENINIKGNRMRTETNVNDRSRIITKIEYRNENENDNGIVNKINSIRTVKYPQRVKYSNSNNNSIVKELKNLHYDLRFNYMKIKNEMNKIEEEENAQYAEKEKKKIVKGYNIYNIPKLEKIIKIFSKRPENRTLRDIIDIKRYLFTTNLASHFLDQGFSHDAVDKILVLCGVELMYVHFSSEETIFKIGQVPKYFYLILSGEVEILKPSKRKVKMNSIEYFSLIMSFQNRKDTFLLNATLTENKNAFPIDISDLKNLPYIFFELAFKSHKSNSYVNFIDLITLCDISPNSLGISNDIELLKSDSYINENKMKIICNIPYIPKEVTKKYEFLERYDDYKDIYVFEYNSFLKLQKGFFFGDSAIDSSSTRNATIVTTVPSDLVFIDRSTYAKHLMKEKQLISGKEANFIHSNFFFMDIPFKLFEIKYFNFFIYDNMTKGEIICNENDEVKYLYFLRRGEISLYSILSIRNIQTLLNELILNNSKISFGEYAKLNNYIQNFSKEIEVKEQIKLFVLSSCASIGIESFYYKLPHFATAKVSSDKARVIKISIDKIKEKILKEEGVLERLKIKAEEKIQIFYSRLLNIYNNKLKYLDEKEYYNQFGCVEKKNLCISLIKKKEGMFNEKLNLPNVNKRNDKLKINIKDVMLFNKGAYIKEKNGISFERKFLWKLRKEMRELSVGNENFTNKALEQSSNYNDNTFYLMTHADHPIMIEKEKKKKEFKRIRLVKLEKKFSSGYMSPIRFGRIKRYQMFNVKLNESCKSQKEFELSNILKQNNINKSFSFRISPKKLSSKHLRKKVIEYKLLKKSINEKFNRRKVDNILFMDNLK